MARRAAGVALLVAVSGFIALASACSNQGEGERCESANGNDDCKTDQGLICYPQGQLRQGAQSDHCCPADRSKAKHPICQTALDIVGDAETPADTGPPPTSDAGDAGAKEAGPEDASSDAADADAQ
ncbi:MAG: hypothetical protein BGO98_46320 [Myxococcales bacterium 68-20]|nr:hypothetical protein [Myxococcales bacterium]OJY23009.1 MAG: hypothetical protein BGO98_46320 [Myxococcales bacterium 68-20]